jgi:creatinine amidohydrolase/Fe(II)-dependent formamide hydrolase-like protein
MVEDFETSMMLYLRPDLVKEHKNLPSSNIELNKPFSAVKKLFKA